MSGDRDTTLNGERAPSSWNYRVLSRTVDTGVPGVEPVEEWVLIEAYYDDEDNLVAWAEAGPMVSDVSLDDLLGEAQLRHKAVMMSSLTSSNRRVLTEVDLPHIGRLRPVSPGEPT